MIALVSARVRRPSSFSCFPFMGSLIDISFSCSSALPKIYSSRISSCSSRFTWPSMSAPSHSPISSSAYSRPRNSLKSASFMAGAPGRHGPPWRAPSPARRASRSPSAPGAPRSPLMAAYSALNASRSGMSLYSLAVGPHNTSSRSHAAPDGNKPITSSSSMSSYSSAFSRASITSRSSSVLAIWIAIFLASGKRSFSPFLGFGAARTTPATPPWPAPLTRFRCWS
mmetsp:Transcript_80424/g.217842  ORF Transcript_80424/g.217842 Transcript_80424/m.217842 type:complete len:226 (+) Transcript_80424:590-1267(+)